MPTARNYKICAKAKVVFIASEPGSATTLGPIAQRMRSLTNSSPYLIFASDRAFSGLKARDLYCIRLTDVSNRQQADFCLKEILSSSEAEVVISTLLGPPETSFDYAARRVCQKMGVRHVVVLDSWMNLESRFAMDTDLTDPCPSIVSVPDHLVRNELMSLGLSQDRIVVTGHPQFDHIRPIKRNLFSNSKNFRICFILQPLSRLIENDNAIDCGYSEAQALDLFFTSVEALDPNLASLDITLREHPRLPSCYKLPTTYPYRINISKGGEGWDIVKTCQVVVGMSSTLLLFSWLAEIPTLITQPGLTQTPDPNILTRYGLVPNAQSVSELTFLLNKAIYEPDFQNDIFSKQWRSNFPLEGSSCDRVIALL